MPFTVHHIVGSTQKLITILPTDTVESALKQMVLNDYSQLPVVDSDNRPLGLITGDSILRAMQHFGVTYGTLSVADAMVKTVYRYDEDDLFEMLDDLRDAYSVLILNSEDKLAGIVTSYDTTEYFRRRAEDMMLVEDIEGALKAHIEEAFRNPKTGQIEQELLTSVVQDITDTKRTLRKRFEGAIRKYLELQGQNGASLDPTHLDIAFAILDEKAAPKTFQDLTLYDYIQLLLHRSRSNYYARVFNLDATAIRHLLDGVRNTRNDLAHFRGEISTDQREQLHFCREWLDRHPVPEPAAVSGGVQTDTDVASLTVEVPVNSAEASTEQVDIMPVEEVIGPNDSRYAPLAIALRGQPAGQTSIMLTFEQIEGIINGSLPPSAKQHRSWWANDSVGHVQSQQWLEVGWRVSNINVAAGRITFARIQEREKAYIDFFSALITDLKKSATFPVYEPTPGGQCWHTASFVLGGQKALPLVFSFARGQRFRVEIYIDTGDQDTNKRFFDKLFQQKNEIEASVNNVLSWERLETRRASRIALYRPGAITDDQEALAQIRQWAVEMMIKFHNGLEPYVRETGQVILANS
jgi:CBS domain-containing protein